VGDRRRAVPPEGVTTGSLPTVLWLIALRREGEQVAVLENRGFGDAAGFVIGDARGGVVFGYLETRTPRQNAM
jgi:hypothetical protein